MGYKLISIMVFNCFFPARVIPKVQRPCRCARPVDVTCSRRGQTVKPGERMGEIISAIQLLADEIAQMRNVNSDTQSWLRKLSAILEALEIQLSMPLLAPRHVFLVCETKNAAVLELNHLPQMSQLQLQRWLTITNQFLRVVESGDIFNRTSVPEVEQILSVESSTTKQTTKRKYKLPWSSHRRRAKQ